MTISHLISAQHCLSWRNWCFVQNLTRAKPSIFRLFYLLVGLNFILIIVLVEDFVILVTTHIRSAHSFPLVLFHLRNCDCLKRTVTVPCKLNKSIPLAITAASRSLHRLICLSEVSFTMRDFRFVITLTDGLVFARPSSFYAIDSHVNIISWYKILIRFVLFVTANYSRHLPFAMPSSDLSLASNAKTSLV